MKTTTLLLALICLATACSKPVSDEEKAAQQKATDFSASIQLHKYKLVAFYSDKPIDYVTSDTEVRSETDLWPYVKTHILDDENYFTASGILTIYQNASKFPGNESAEIAGNYGVSARGVDVVFNFVDYIYVPTEYKLQEFDNNQFIIYIAGPSGSKLYSKFARIE